MDEISKSDSSKLLTDDFYNSVSSVLEQARNHAYRAVNSAMVSAYWKIGRLIVEKQGGKERAAYGEALIKELSAKLTADFGKGFTVTNLKYMRQFYSAFQNGHALRGELSWTHYRSLSRVADEDARTWYMNECANEGDNPTLGIVLCAETDKDVAHYSMLNGSEQLFAAKYLTYLPTEEQLKAEIERQKAFFEGQQQA